MILFLALLSLQMEPVNKSPGVNVFAVMPRLANGGVLYPAGDGFMYWASNGSAKFFSTEHLVQDVFWDGEFFWAGGNRKATIFDETGIVVGRFDGLSSYNFHGMQEEVILSTCVTEEAIQKGVFLPMATPIKTVRKVGVLEFFHDHSFSKITQKMVNLDLQFRRLFIVQKSGTYYVVDEIDPQVRVYGHQEKKRETIQGFKAPDTTPHSVKLDLARKSPMPKARFDNIEHSMLLEAAQSKILEWWHSCPVVTYFNEMEDGFLIAYRIPKSINSELVGFTLGIQRLGPGPNFLAVGELLEIEGVQNLLKLETAISVAGTIGNSVAIFHPSLTEDGGMKPQMEYWNFENGSWALHLPQR